MKKTSPNFPEEKMLQDIYLYVYSYVYAYTKALLELKGGEGSGNFGHAGRPGLVGGSAGDGGNGLSAIAISQNVDIINNTFPPSITLEKDIMLYHATSKPEKIRRRGLNPQLPPEVSEGADSSDWDSLTGVYLTDRESAQAYLDGRLNGNGEILSIWIVAGTVVYQDPVDYGSVFIRGAIPPRAIE